PAQGGRGVRRGQFPRPLRIDRARPDRARRDPGGARTRLKRAGSGAHRHSGPLVKQRQFFNAWGCFAVPVPDTLSPAVNHLRMRHRILQYEGRRYSLKLDTIVWEVLEDLAQQSGRRLNELVARIAEDAGDDAG